MQHQDYTKEWNKLCECLINKPMTDLAKLSIDTFNNNLKASSDQWNEFISRSNRRPEELLSTQVKLLMDTTARAIECMQQAMGIFVESYANFSKEFSHITSDMTSEMSKPVSVVTSKMREKQ